MSDYAPNSVSAGAVPQTPLGSLQRSPDSLAGFKGLTSKGSEGKGWRMGGEREE